MNRTNNIPATTRQSGSIVVIILIIMLFLTTMLFGAIMLANENLNRAWQRLMLLQAQYAAESGADYAITTLNNLNSSYSGTGASPSGDITVLSSSSLYKATFSVTVSTSGSTATITSTGKVYKPKNAATAAYTRKIRVTAQQTSGSYSSAIMSSNNIIVDSSVKNVTVNDVLLNGYFKANKNTTNINFTKMTVAGKDSASGSSNCSIGGSGTLINYPSSSKATIDMAYSNCITPPGNTSNSNFNVTANDNNISKIQSLYIPWSQYMDNSYSSSPSGCNDWTGASPITIPSTGNAKKTHYPDSGSGIASTCGTSGVLALGSKQYNFNDNLHIRADLCSYSSPCHPIFNNTSSSLRYIFVEGDAFFSGIDTASGSGPIVIETYGADSSAIPNNHCNGLGASIYLGNDGSNATNAPSVYLLSKNNICMDQSKFGSAQALGGAGGHNMYIATNSGTPFDLNLYSVTFPYSSIPINLAWRATGYERL